MKLTRLGAALAAFAAALVFAAAIRAQPQNTAPRGKAVYDVHCVECHGRTGHGDGPAASFLSPRPRDFTTGKYKIRTTETASIPTDDDVTRSVRQGLHGSAMPAWEKLLSDAQIADVVAYVKTLSSRFGAEQPMPVKAGTPVPTSPDSIARGHQVYEKLQCGKCHGSDGRGTNAVTTSFTDDHNQPLAATTLTEPWTFRGGSTAGDIFMRFRTGMTGTPMPSFLDAAKDNEMWDLANYVVSLARKPVWEMNADEVKAFYSALDTAERTDPVKRGAQLVTMLNCSMCHSPTDDEGRVLPGMHLAGGTLFRIEPFGDFVSYNLTSDKDTGLGNWTDDQIKQVITRGTRPDGSRMLPYPMDWPSFATLKPDDISAIIAFLRTVPPVSNRIPKPKSPFLPVYLWGKFRMLVLGWDAPMTIFHHNAGSKGGQS